MLGPGSAGCIGGTCAMAMPRRREQGFYGTAAWKRLSKRVLARDGYRCYACGRRATSTDHIVPVDEAPWLGLVESNCRASCAKHNMGRGQQRFKRMAMINRSTAKVREW